jgi:serine/threonine protein kinase
MTSNRPTWRPSGASSDGTVTVTHRYEPIAEIGVGGMGAVVLARALSGPSAGEHVAMKRLLPHLAQDPDVLKAFLDEVYVISAMHHPHIVESIDWGLDENGRFLVMQFVPGDSLRALVHAREARKRPLPIALVAEVIACAALGLNAAHTLEEEGRPLGIVHQDISPANILVGYDGGVKVIDFGVARILSREDDAASQTIRGKFGYMSPEQIRGMPLDHRSDLFSLGVVLWESLTLSRLYPSKDEFEIARLVVSEEPQPPSALRTDVPPELDRIVLRCLSKRCEDRYRDGRALAHDLEPFRPPRAQRADLVAYITRESMPERLAWIESVLSRKVTIAPRVVGTHDDGPTPSRALAPHSAAAPNAQGAPAPSPPPGTTASPPVPSTPAAEPTDPPPTAPTSDPRAATTRLIVQKSAAPVVPVAPMAPDPVKRSTPTDEDRRRTPRKRSPRPSIAVRVGALAAVAVIALVVGMILGSR